MKQKWDEFEDKNGKLWKIIHNDVEIMYKCMKVIWRTCQISVTM